MIKYLADLNNLHINIQFIIVCLNMKICVITLITLFPAGPLKECWEIEEISKTFSPPTVSDLREENMQNVGSKYQLLKIFSSIIP